MNACPSCGVPEGAQHLFDCENLIEVATISRMQDGIKAAELAIIGAVTALADRWPIDIEAVDLEGIDAEGMTRRVYVCSLRVVVRRKALTVTPLQWPGPTTPGPVE